MKKVYILMAVLMLSTVLFAQRQQIQQTTKQTTTTSAVKAAAEDSKPSAEVIKGQIVSLKGLVLGTDGKVSKDEALTLAAKGDPIVFLYNGKVYFPFHENGSFAYEKAAQYANRANVGIVGKMQTKNGVNSIIVTRIVSLD